MVGACPLPLFLKMRLGFASPGRGQARDKPRPYLQSFAGVAR